jgi:peroxiredoxin
MDAIPHLINLRKKYPTDKVEIIGVDASDNSIEGIQKLIKEKSINYTIISSPLEVIKKYSVSVFPTVYLLDKSGVIIHSEMGFGESDFEKRISDIVDKHL